IRDSANGLVRRCERGALPRATPPLPRERVDPDRARRILVPRRRKPVRTQRRDDCTPDLDVDRSISTEHAVAQVELAIADDAIGILHVEEDVTANLVVLPARLANDVLDLVVTTCVAAREILARDDAAGLELRERRIEPIAIGRLRPADLCELVRKNLAFH